MKQIFAFILAVLPLIANAGYYDVEINGIYYKLNNDSKEATVAMGCKEVDVYNNPISVSSYAGDVVIPESFTFNGISYTVTSIEGHATIGLTRLYSYGAFESCEDLNSITIPKTIKTIGLHAFSGCSSLQSVYISDLAAWCNICFDLDGLSFPYYPDANPLSFAHNLYLKGNKISDLIIPEEVTTIKAGAFIGSSISSVVFHKNFSKIGYKAFDDCSNLNDVYCYSPRIETKESFVSHEDKTLHFRKRYKNNYTSDEYVGYEYEEWKKFGKTEYIEGVDFLLEYYVDGVFYKDTIMEVGEAIIPEPAPSKDDYTFSGWSDIPETMPDHNVTVTGSFIPNETTKQCSTPSLAFVENKLIFDCETEDAEFHYEIKIEDAKEGVGSEVSLSSAYEISVYASKEGYNDSPKNTATLYWINVEPTTTGVIENEMRVNTNAILVQNTGGVIAISGVADGENVLVYNISGQLIAQGNVSGNHVEIGTKLSSGDICIIKIGDKSVKYLLK